MLTYGDDAKGMSVSEKVYDDANADEIESLPETALHRHVDLPIVRADKEGSSSFIVSFISPSHMFKDILSRI